MEQDLLESRIGLAGACTEEVQLSEADLAEALIGVSDTHRERGLKNQLA